MARHLTTTADLTNGEIEAIFAEASGYLHDETSQKLRGKLVINIFFENSTRTRSSFEVASRRLGAEVVSLDVLNSSESKGETLYDTAANLDAMGASAIVVRHKNAGVPKMLSKYVGASVINGGDGAHAHPTQALLDLFTLRQALGSVKGKKIAIVGDIKNSRVANSNIDLLTRFGMEVILVAPPHFQPNRPKLRSTWNILDVIDEIDALMTLRTQTERHNLPLYSSLSDYAANFKITKNLLGDRNIALLHPGPVHRNVELEDSVLSDKRSLVLRQVRNGVAVRMAVLSKFVLGENSV
ncbi:MAG: aspartate carbamoyltransferase catalytic subunit [Helicobacteraceae bacterium]|jgi:aspartate carbamoyltransferase catalytic subunit|nr:aspartate carbamoyltransferase catalytic subunit [Helicobacteraceae bacterium]